MATYTFGTGAIFAARTDITNATPLPFGTLQDVSVDFAGDIKELYGQNQFPVQVARGKVKVSGKAKVGQLSGQLFNTLFFGQTMATGQVAMAYNESEIIAAASPYQVTVVNATTFVTDFGAIYLATGLPLTKVASAPATGQYSVAAGIYTFNTADAGKAVLINYTYSVPALGQQFTMVNPLMGSQPVFQLALYGYNLGKPATMTLLQCVAPKLSIATKQDDFMIPEIEFSAFANAAGQVFTWSFFEAS